MELELRPLSHKWFDEATPLNYKLASATIGSGTNGEVTIVKDTIDSVDSEDYSVSIVIPLEESALSASFDGESGELEISLSVGAAEKAGISIGSGTNGTVEIEADTAGDAGNDFTITIVNGGNGASMSAGLVSDDITLTLGMTSAVAATTTIGSGDNGVVTITADTAGDAGNDFTVEVILATGANQALSSTFIEGALVVSLGTDGDELADDLKNTASLIATEIASKSGIGASASGTGETPISEAIAEKNFEGGLDSTASAVKNTATLVAVAIAALSGVTARATGSGEDSISATLTKTSFTGGSDIGVNTVGNEASTIAEVVSEVSPFVAVASGNGSSSITTEDEVDFDDGSWGTPCPQAGITLQGDSYFYVCLNADNNKFNNGWRRYTLSNY